MLPAVAEMKLRSCSSPLTWMLTVGVVCGVIGAGWMPPTTVLKISSRRMLGWSNAGSGVDGSPMMMLYDGVWLASDVFSA